MLTITDFLSIIESGECHNVNPKFHKGVVIERDGYFYGLYCNGSNGVDNSILNPMREVLVFLDELDWDYKTICDISIDVTDDVYYWLFAFKNEQEIQLSFFV